MHCLRLDSPTNIGSVGLFPVKTSSSMIPKLNTSLLLDALPMNASSNQDKKVKRVH
jgi:hypothetical protein